MGIEALSMRTLGETPAGLLIAPHVRWFLWADWVTHHIWILWWYCNARWEH